MESLSRSLGLWLQPWQNSAFPRPSLQSLVIPSTFWSVQRTTSSFKFQFETIPAMGLSKALSSNLQTVLNQVERVIFNNLQPICIKAPGARACVLQASGPVMIDRSFAGFHSCEKRKAQHLCRNNQSLAWIPLLWIYNQSSQNFWLIGHRPFFSLVAPIDGPLPPTNGF